MIYRLVPAALDHKSEYDHFEPMHNPHTSSQQRLYLMVSRDDCVQVTY